MDLIEQPTGAAFNRGKSKQDYPTPPNFREAIRTRFGPIDTDLAATIDNTLAPHFFDLSQDSFTQDWLKQCHGQCFLNPPFGDIAPWAKKCSEEARRGTRILFLVPASVGTNWFANYVHDRALVYFLSPRLCFDGKHPFPKDMLLASYNDRGIQGRVGYQCWRWRP